MLTVGIWLYCRHTLLSADCCVISWHYWYVDDAAKSCPQQSDAEAIFPVTKALRPQTRPAETGQQDSDQIGHGCQSRICFRQLSRVQKDGPQGQWEEMLWVVCFSSVFPNSEMWLIISPVLYYYYYIIELCAKKKCSKWFFWSHFLLCWPYVKKADKVSAGADC